MRIIVGLGNPGPEFKNTRHNLGFYLVDKFQTKKGLSPFVNFLGSYISVNLSISGEKFILCKPAEFMNNSGKTLLKLLNYFNISPDSTLLIYDELDVLLGNFKLSKRVQRKISHRGVQDIVSSISCANILKLKLGIGPQSRKNLIIKEYVMAPFDLEELKLIEKIEDRIFKILDRFVVMPDKFLFEPVNYLLMR